MSDISLRFAFCRASVHRLGEAMLAASTKIFGRGFNFISLTVTEANDRAIALYKRIGFDRAECLTRLYGRDNGGDLDADED